MTVRPSSWPARLAWFAGLWISGVVTVGAVAYMLRLWLKT